MVVFEPWLSVSVYLSVIFLWNINVPFWCHVKKVFRLGLFCLCTVLCILKPQHSVCDDLLIIPCRGRHGRVRRVIEKCSGREYAAKFIQVREAVDKEFFRSELENLSKQKSKSVVSVHDAYETPRQLIIVTELYPNVEILSAWVDGVHLELLWNGKLCDEKHGAWKVHAFKRFLSEEFCEKRHGMRSVRSLQVFWKEIMCEANTCLFQKFDITVYTQLGIFGNIIFHLLNFILTSVVLMILFVCLFVVVIFLCYLVCALTMLNQFVPFLFLTRMKNVSAEYWCVCVCVCVCVCLGEERVILFLMD